ncbi:MAG: hypothetical protein AAFY33_13925 [Cyanobacteria bacterium J06643_4]
MSKRKVNCCFLATEAWGYFIGYATKIEYRHIFDSLLTASLNKPKGIKPSPKAGFSQKKGVFTTIDGYALHSLSEII